MKDRIYGLENKSLFEKASPHPWCFFVSVIQFVAISS